MKDNGSIAAEEAAQEKLYQLTTSQLQDQVTCHLSDTLSSLSNW